MLSSVPSLRLLLSLLVIFVATVYTVTANDGEKSKTPANTHSAKDSDEKDAKTEAAPEKNKGDKAEPNHADENAPTVKSQIIQLAPEVELLNNGDISVKGDCKGDINTFCAHVKAGSSHLAECLQNRIEDEEEGSAELLGTVSKECKEEVIGYKMNLAKNINYDTAMANACKADAEEHCKDLNDITVDGKVITCLREMKPSLSAKCRDHITRAQLEAARDYRIDAAVYESCKMDAYKFCKGVEAGSGRVNACLRSHRDEVQYDCVGALFRMDMENADDIRLNAALFKVCLNDKRRFCPDVFPGNGRAQICLEEHMDKPDFTTECKSALEDRIEMMSRDYRLDPVIRRTCRPDIQIFCEGQDESLQATIDTKGTVMECLKRNHEQLKRRPCRDAVARSIERSARNVRYATGIAGSCQDDRTKLCSGLLPGDARVIRCLQEARARLSPGCSTSLFDHEVMISESIDFNHPLKQACLDEIEDTCDGIPHGDARVIRCLQDGDRKKFSRKCTKELAAVEKKMGEDFRFNHRLESACEEDANVLCSKVCDGTLEFRPCGGKVLHCLIENQSQVKARACKKEVSYYIKMEVSNFGNDVILAEACRKDVDDFCSEVAPGDGRVHECLRERRAQLSDRCAKEELRLEIQESQNFDLRPSLKKVCVQERNVFCGEVATGGARVFRCLAHNLAKADFGEACRSEIKAKLMRRQQNWKLDVALRNACKVDAKDHCSDVDHGADKAETARCLISHHSNLTDSCAHEVSRASYMALNVYQEDGPLTQVCAEDAAVCADILTDAVVARTGSVLACLERMHLGSTRNGTKSSHKLAPSCAELLAVAKPPDDKLEFESNLQMIAKLDFKKKLAGVGMWDNRKGVTITGYTALACFSALCTSVAMALMHLYKRWRGIRDDGYVQVVKRGDL